MSSFTVSGRGLTASGLRLSPLASVFIAGAAYGTEPTHGADPAHGSAAGGAPGGADGSHAATDAHGAAEGADHGGAGGGHGEHTCYTCDDDGDGTANWMDGDAGHSYALGALGWHALNLALFIGVMVWFAGPAIKSALATRAIAIRTELDEAARQKAEAKARYDAVQGRLAKLEAEIAGLVKTAREDGLAEEARVAQRATEAAARIADTAQRQIRDEAARARQELRREAVELAVQLAEGIVRGQVQAADQRRLAQEFLEEVQKAGAAEGPHV